MIGVTLPFFFVPFLRVLYDYTHSASVDYTNYTIDSAYELHVCD